MIASASRHSRLSQKQRQGLAAETLALAYLTERGLACLARNVRYRVGELDLVMRDGSVVVFVEVRFRRPSRFGNAASTVNFRKQRRLIRAAHCWIAQFTRKSLPIFRFDVVAIDGSNIQWIPNAFSLDAAL